MSSGLPIGGTIGDGLNFLSFFSTLEALSALARNADRLGLGLKHAFR